MAAQEASDCRAKLARDSLELGKIVNVKTGQVTNAIFSCIAESFGQVKEMKPFSSGPNIPEENAALT